jgi:hypothetical protein
VARWRSSASASIQSELSVAVIALLRTVRHERPYASLQLARTHPEWFLATLTITNPSRLVIKLEKLAISLPDFRWAHLPTSMDAEWKTESIIGAPVPNGPIFLKPGESADVKFAVFQALHSRKKTANVQAYYHTMEPKPKWRSVQASARTRLDF